MDWLTFIFDLLADESKHFLLSAFLGSWAFFQTWIMLYAFLSGWVFLTQRKANMVVVYGILICCILVGVSYALAGHWLLDYWRILYTTPLNPPLQLKPQT